MLRSMDGARERDMRTDQAKLVTQFAESRVNVGDFVVTWLIRYIFQDIAVGRGSAL
jgi:hypothetical protein